MQLASFSRPKWFKFGQIQGARVQQRTPRHAEFFTKAIPINHRPATPFLNILLHLFLRILLLEANIRTIKILRVHPSNGRSINLDTIEEQYIRRPKRTPVVFLLLLDHLRLTAQTHAAIREPVGQYIFEQIGAFVGVSLIGGGHDVGCLGGFELAAFSFGQVVWFSQAFFDFGFGPSHLGEDLSENIHGRVVEE